MKPIAIAALLLMSGVVLGAGPKLVVWNGEDAKGGGGWGTQADLKPKVVDNEGHSGKSSLCLAFDGSEWIGWGWNWFSWWPADSGTDVSDYKVLSFWVKVTGDAKITVLQTTLASNDGKHGESVDAFKYCPKLADGKWVEVRIPLKDLLGEKPELDLKKVWELHLGQWSQDAVKCNVFVDDIGFDKNAADPAGK